MHPLLEMALGNAVAATALAMIVLAVARLTRKPAWTHCLWLLVLLKLLTPPVISIPLPASWIPRPAPHEVEISDRDVVSDPPGSVAGMESRASVDGSTLSAEHGTRVAGQLEGSDRVIAELFGAIGARLAPMATALFYIWVGGTVVVVLGIVFRICRFRRALRWATVAPGFLQREAESLGERIGVARCPRVWLLDGNVSPMLWALLGEANLLFPAELLERLSPEARRALLLHELAHLRRGDHWVRLLEMAVTALYWWHPVVWWARREIQIAEEECCDSWVVSEMPDGRATYAAALVEAACFLSERRRQVGLPAAASGLGGFAFMKHRVTMIMLGDRPERLSPLGRLAVVAAALLCLPLLPTWAGVEHGEQKAGDWCLSQMGGRAASTKVDRLDLDKRTPIPLLPKPLLRYRDQPREIFDATLWVWGTSGRPTAFQKVEYYRLPGLPAREWLCYMASSSDGPIEADWGDGQRWSSSKPGITLRVLSRGSTPEAGEGDRLEQMARAAHRITATRIEPPIPERMQLLANPIYRYSDPASGLQDGAVFAFASNGSNPDLLLVIELHGKDLLGSEWKYGLIRMTAAGLSVRLDQSEVWSAPCVSSAFVADGSATSETWTAFFESNRTPNASAP